MSKVYLVSGQIGSGKTTYSKLLEKKTGAIRFSPDEWMLKLYPFEISNDEFDYYFFICCDIAWDTAKKLVSKNIDIILDFGFWRKSERKKYTDMIEELGLDYKLFYIYCPEATIIDRLRKRNKEKSEGSFYISDESFNYFSPGFEPPSQEEIFELIDNS